MVSTFQQLKIIFSILMLLGFGQIQAQNCEHLGVISRGFLLGEFSCDLLIVSSNGLNVFQPIELSDEFSPGNIIQFSYETLDSTDCSADIPLINITCIAPFFGSEDSLLTDCNFAIESTPVDSVDSNTFQLEVFNETDFGPFHPQSVRWYEYETGRELGNEAIINYTLTENSPPVVNICADITVDFLDNNVCEATLCHTIIPETIFPSIDACQALFVYLPTDQISSNGTINFFNLSFGDFSEIIWDFGDGQTSDNSSLTFSHTYASPGLYEVCLTIQDESSGCQSSFCLPVFTVGGDEICSFNDCVFPGDANRNGTVNIFDVLNIGLGFNATGENRPNAVIAPFLQASFDWDLTTFFNLNFKHIDCNGDGTVDENDFTAISQNYQPINENESFVENTNLPAISLNFLTDTLFVSPEQTEVTIPAQISLANENLPINDFYGMALAFDYNSSLVRDIKIAYNETSFIGPSETVLVRDRLLTNEQEYGLAITRNDQQGVTGAGEIGTVSFILELDIIGGRMEVLEIDIKDILTVDSNGVEIPISVTDDTSSIVIVLDENVAVSTEEKLAENQFQIYPNPTQHELFIDLAKSVNLKNSKVQIFNTLGQIVLNQILEKNQTTLYTNALNSGVYWVKIYTEQGVAVQEIVIE